MREDRNLRNIERLEARRKLLEQRLEHKREWFNQQIERKQAELNNKLNKKQEDIIAAALVLLDEDGLTNLSLRKLADKLDVKAPALYWYFKNKEMLIDYLAEAILYKEFSDLSAKQPNETWQHWLEVTMNKLRKAMLDHNDGARVVAGAHLYPAVTLGKIFELSITTLHADGFSLKDAMQLTGTATAYTFGYVIEEQSSPDMDELAMHIDRLTQDYPMTAKAVTETHKCNKTQDSGYDFNKGLKLIINGASKA